MKKTAAEIHNELVDRVENEKEYMKEYRETPSDYQIGYYDALCIFLKWIEEME
jgi:predicted nucleic acid-binding protein